MPSLSRCAERISDLHDSTMPLPDLTAIILERFKAMAVGADNANAAVLSPLVEKLSTEPHMGRSRIFELAKASAEAIDGPAA